MNIHRENVLNQTNTNLAIIAENRLSIWLSASRRALFMKDKSQFTTSDSFLRQLCLPRTLSLQQCAITGSLLLPARTSETIPEAAGANSSPTLERTSSLAFGEILAYRNFGPVSFVIGY